MIHALVGSVAFGAVLLAARPRHLRSSSQVAAFLMWCTFGSLGLAAAFKVTRPVSIGTADQYILGPGNHVHLVDAPRSRGSERALFLQHLPWKVPRIQRPPQFQARDSTSGGGSSRRDLVGGAASAAWLALGSAKPVWA